MGRAVALLIGPTIMCDDRVVYLMIGLPSCGKSYTAKRVAKEYGAVFEVDRYFYEIAGSDPRSYDFQRSLLPTAHEWNLQRFCEAITTGIAPIVVDHANSVCLETQRYARYAIDHSYRVEIREPESEWWQEIRVLLKYKDLVWPILERWAVHLSELSKTTHRVEADMILARMKHWKHELTLKDILDYTPQTTGNRQSSQ